MKHACFKNIPIDGSYENFCQQLFQLGFTHKEGDNFLTGKFANELVCVNVSCTPKSNLVCSVIIRFREIDLWDTLKEEYLRFKELYRKKYGEPEIEIEEFIYPYVEGDGDELLATYDSHCNYITSYVIPGGIAALTLENKRLALLIKDDINSEIKEKEDEEVAYDDI